MRNLKNINHSTLIPNSDLEVSAATWDPSTDSLLCAFGPSEDNSLIEIRRWPGKTPGTSQGKDSTVLVDELPQIVASWDAPSPSPDLPSDKIIDLYYFGDEKKACVVLAGGDIALVREDPLPDEEDIEIVGSVDAGISGAKWSPDEDLLVISTGSHMLLFMTRQFEITKEVSMTPDDLKASKHVSVGWGKSETQFKGKRAKALLDPTMPTKVEEGALSPFDRHQVAVSWRGDGVFMAISSVESDIRRVIRIYSREGILDSVSEPVDGLEAALSWRPAGNLIAGIQRLQDHVDVIFFERNGLRHGQFSLRLTAEEMNAWNSDIFLDWNYDSTVLAVSLKDRVQLWTMGNYHYYLKQEIVVSETSRSLGPIRVSWKSYLPLSLAIYSSDIIKVLEYMSVAVSGSTIPPDDLGLVTVVDGNTVKLTYMRLANIPPPMAGHEIIVRSNVVDVAPSRNGTLIAVLLANGVDLYKCNPKAAPMSYSLVGQTDYPDIYYLVPQQIACLHNSDIYVLCVTSSESMIFKSQIELGILSKLQLVYQSKVGIVCLFSRSDHAAVLIQDAAHVVMEGRLEDSSLHMETVCQFPAPTRLVQASLLGERCIGFGLTNNGSLYANRRLLTTDCTSFLIANSHLIFTTTHHYLKFVHLTNADDIFVPGDEPGQDERCRSIERGARLVTVMPTAFSVVLQMPRGNLETIYPRALVVAEIRRSIAAKDYKSAFLACRAQKVDMNIIHDHAPKQFLSNIDLFMKQVNKVEHIDLFLSQLREDDVTQTMYKQTLPILNSDTEGFTKTIPPSSSNRGAISSGVQSKVNSICNAFLAVLAAYMPSHLQNIITAHVCKVPPNLEDGLSVVARLREDNSDLVEKAVEHICFLADVNQLYENALGIYDLELALLVAQQSQKDPREYLPFLRSLHEMSQLRRQYVIDNHLRRYPKALKHLYDLGGFKEFKDYMTEHQLYKPALSMYQYEPERLNEVKKLYAEYLENKSQFKEAGLAYESVAMYEKAMQAYRAAGCWRETLYCASQAFLPTATVEELAVALADALYESKNFFDAANLYFEYRHDVETAAKTFCKGSFFAEAMRLIATKGDCGLLESIVDQALVEGMANTTELLADFKGQIAAQVSRLRELRAKKLEDPFAFYDGTSTADIPDNVSIAATDMSTNPSIFTRYTNRTGTINTHTSRKTSKNRRREERKRAMGKKGSVYEEEYLVNSMRRLVERVNSVGDEVSRLVEGLVRRRMWERATAVEKAMSGVVELCKGCLFEVFSAAQPDEQPGSGTSNGGAENIIAGQALYGKMEPPVVLPFQRLTLLDT